MLIQKEEDFIFPARPFNEKILPDFKDYLIQIPTRRQTKEKKEETIPCLFKKNPNSKKLLIFFHCNGGDMFNAYYYVTEILKNFNFNFLFPEYPAYTIYNAPKSSQKVLDDSLIIYDFCLKNIKNLTEKNIYIFGRSLGTGPAVYISSQRNPAGTFLLSPYTTFAKVGKRFHEPDFYQNLTKHLRSIDYIANVKCPLCIFHGKQDVLIYPEESEILFKKCENNDKKELHLIDGMDHNNVINYRDEMKPIAEKFIEKYCPFEENKENITLDLDKSFYLIKDNANIDGNNNNDEEEEEDLK